MEKKTLFAMVVLVALGAAAAATMLRPEKGQRQGAAARPIAAIKAADVTSLEITSDKQQTTTLTRKDKDAPWQVGGHNADPQLVKMLVDSLEKLSFGDLVTENEAKEEEFGVQQGKAPRIVAKVGDKVLADLVLGKTVGSFTMGRIPGKKGVWQVGGVQAGILNKEPSAWRDHTILSFTATDADKLAITTATGSALEVERQAEGKKWKLVSQKGEAPESTDALDADLAQATVAALSTLKANEFVDDKAAADLGLDKPVLTLAATTKTGKQTLLVGKTVGDDTYVQVEGAPQLYSLKKFALDRVGKRPIDFRDKTLAKIKEADLAGIEVAMGKDGTVKLERDGAGWKLVGGDGDPNKLKGVAGSFEQLVAAGLDEAAGRTGTRGLDKPTATVTVRGKDKSTLMLKIGELTADKTEYYVQKAGKPEIYRAKKYLIERFLKKPADLAKEKKT